MDNFRPSFSRRLVGNGPVTVLEIGANDGMDSSEFVRTFTHRDSHLYCFECDRRAIKRWKARVNHPRATLVETALAECSGTLQFYPSGGNAPGACWRNYGDWDKSGSILEVDKHTEHSPWLKFSSPITVPVVTLDEWAEQNIPGRVIDFCWVDVQGAEHLVLAGATRTLPRIRYWYCECDPRPNYKSQASLDELQQILSDAGFTYEGEYGDYNHLWKNKSPAKTPSEMSQRALSAKSSYSPVTVRFMGQFGNQLFQYVGGKILSNLTGLTFQPPKTFLTKSGKPVNWTKKPLFALEPSLGEIRTRGESLTYSGDHWIDWKNYSSRDVRSVALRHGYLQRYECLQPWKDKIKQEWLNLQSPFLEVDQDAIHIHCRRTDYVPGVNNPNDPSRHGIASTLDEYAACLKVFPDAKRLVVYTDDMKDPWLQQFRKFGLPWTISGSAWDEDFLAMASCRFLLIAQSTFSWWAGFLGKAELIACPLRKETLWHYGKDLRGPPKGKDYPNLIVYDEPERWKWIEL